MHIPVVIDPRIMCPKDAEFDGDRIVRCMCGEQMPLGLVKLAYVQMGPDEKSIGYYAVCNLGCYTARCIGGRT